MSFVIEFKSMLSTLLHWFAAFAYSYVPSRGSSEARTSTLSTSGFAKQLKEKKNAQRWLGNMLAKVGLPKAERRVATLLQYFPFLCGQGC